MEESEARKEAKEAFKKWVLLGEVHWRQKSREIWLKEGDRNTGFFHRVANSHLRKNALVKIKIKINGEWFSGEQEIREGVSNAFKLLLTENLEWRANINGLLFEALDPTEARSLEAPFGEEEIFCALKEMNGGKASGLDGFSLVFWKESWHFVKVEVLEMFREFHESGTFTRSLNATFLVLIPKKGGAEDLSDIRPISLVGSLYKLLAKVLVSRLKKVVGKVVSTDQNAFIEG